MRQFVAGLAVATVTVLGLSPAGTTDAVAAVTTPIVTMAVGSTTLTAGEYLTVTGRRTPALAGQGLSPMALL